MKSDRHEEAACLYGLGLLEGAERASFEAELRADPQLQTLVADLQETANFLAFTAPAAEPSAFLRERLLASARPLAPSAAATASAPPRRSAPAAFGWAAAAGFALLASYLGWQYQQAQLQLDQQRSAVLTAQAEADVRVAAAMAESEAWRDRLQHEREQSSGIIAELRRQTDVAELKVASLASLLGQSPEAQAIAVWNPLTQEGVLTVVNLPALETDKDYQLWLIDPQYDIPVDGGVFRVDPTTGEARVTFRPDRPVRIVDKFAVSLERSGGVPKAEGPMVLLGP